MFLSKHCGIIFLFNIFSPNTIIEIDRRKIIAIAATHALFEIINNMIYSSRKYINALHPFKFFFCKYIIKSIN